MKRVYLDSNYPKNLVEALKLIHGLQSIQKYDIARTQEFDDSTALNTVVFLFDRSKKDIEIVTEKHFDAGYKVFAFKSNSTEKIDLFQLSLAILNLWPKMLNVIDSESKPFVFTYKYDGKKLSKARG
jgi:hypothetical protein